MRSRSLTLQFPTQRACLVAVFVLLVRALIPVGYMLDAAHGHAQLSFCGASSASGAPDSPGGHQGPAGDAPCAFALSAGAAPLPVLPALAPLLLTVSPTVKPYGFVLPASPPHRHAAARGPPSLA